MVGKFFGDISVQAAPVNLAFLCFSRKIAIRTKHL